MRITNAWVFLGDTFIKGSVSFDERFKEVQIEGFEEVFAENRESVASAEKTEGSAGEIEKAKGSAEVIDTAKGSADATEKAKGSAGAIEKAERSAGAIDIKEKVLDAEGGYLIPGLVDIHTHAAVDADASDGDIDGLHRMAKYYASGGVTTFFPTTLTLPEEQLIKAIAAVREFKEGEGEARIGGIHLEGPFINPEKRGAQNPDYIRKPDIEMFQRLTEAGPCLVKFITIAPETEGAIEFIKEISKFCRVSLGHTNCDYDTAMQAFEAGASHITHLYNAMPALMHRAPGLIAAGIDAGAEAELIVDGLHSHPSMVRLAHMMFGENLILISDSARCAGMPEGEYELGGLPIELKEGKATIKGSDTIAGSAIHLMDGLRNAVRFGIPLEDAVYAATTRPAISARIDHKVGAIKQGLYADMVLLDRELNVRAVLIGGKPVKSRTNV